MKNHSVLLDGGCSSTVECATVARKTGVPLPSTALNKMTRNFLRGLRNEKESMKKKDRKKLRWINRPKKELKDKEEEDKK